MAERTGVVVVSSWINEVIPSALGELRTFVIVNVTGFVGMVVVNKMSRPRGHDTQPNPPYEEPSVVENSTRLVLALK